VANIPAISRESADPKKLCHKGMWCVVILKDTVQDKGANGAKERTMAKRYPPKLKFQIVHELLQDEQKANWQRAAMSIPTRS